MPTDYPAYLVLVVLVVLAPGPDLAMIVRNSVVAGPAGGLLTGCGTATGLLLQGAAVAGGVAAVVVRTGWALRAIQVAGALYLAYLGVQAVRSALAARRDPGADGGGRTPREAGADNGRFPRDPDADGGVPRSGGPGDAPTGRGRRPSTQSARTGRGCSPT
ncbi:LysE family transporter [Micromonospora olivasterospora]|uniref:LysE type translocator n=1 Tax=Micromonospora olivasterospora TaxID=1880 RepID=A0A562I2D5_MICOL|nr:LysE family transporter [Micromonospora olivasterospora]TWH65112.1 LysE type translocator [Micromonospora olivasterospora]